MKLTTFEALWVRIMATIVLVVVGVLFLRPYLPNISVINPEPLADATSLKLLESGQELPVPTQESHAIFHGTPVVPPEIATLTQVQQVLGDATTDDKRIEVDLTNQRVYAYEGTRRVYEFIVSTGKWGLTPTGEFRIWTKVRSQTMSGGSQRLGTYYYLPGVPYVMFFSNDEIAKSRGYSLHGTYWHNNFGHPMSHGCINMKIEDAKTLYEWANPPVTNTKAWSTLATSQNPGTKVVIYGVTPKE